MTLKEFVSRVDVFPMKILARDFTHEQMLDVVTLQCWSDLDDCLTDYHDYIVDKWVIHGKTNSEGYPYVELSLALVVPPSEH